MLLRTVGEAVRMTMQTLGPESESLLWLAWRKFRRHRLALFSVFAFAAIAVIVVGAPIFDRYPPNRIDLRATFSPPGAQHWLGTDALGRDIWSRLIHGGRVSLAVGLSATIISVLIGVALGAISGYYGGSTDMIIMRLTDIFMTFPSFLIMLTVAALVGPGLGEVIVIIGAFSWPPVTRLIRGQFLSLKKREFVEAARAVGANDSRIIIKHILPNAIPPLLAQITLQVGSAILTEAGLSFLGMGVPMPTPSWGNMLEPARTLEVLQLRPWVWIPAAVMILLTVLCINFIGDGLRDAIGPR